MAEILHVYSKVAFGALKYTDKISAIYKKNSKSFIMTPKVVYFLAKIQNAHICRIAHQNSKIFWLKLTILKGVL